MKHSNEAEKSTMHATADFDEESNGIFKNEVLLLDTSLNDFDRHIDKPIIEDTKSDEQNEFFLEYDFFIEDSSYYRFEGKRGARKISNFVAEFLYRIDDGSDDSERIILIQRRVLLKDGDYRFDYFLITSTSTQLTKNTFEAKLKSKGCTYYGTAYTFQRICEFLMLNEKTAIKIGKIGWDTVNKVYAFNNRILVGSEILIPNEHNVVASGNVFYYLESKQPLYNYQEGSLCFKQFADLIYKAYNSNAISGILYLLLALFRDFIFARLGFFPHLFLYGEAGTGKTNFIQHFLHIFGKDIIGDPLDNSTSIGISRKLNQRVNSLYYLKEYKPEVEKNVGDIFLSGYDGAGRLSGVKSNDNNTLDMPVLSAMAIDGNYLPSTSQLLRRMILLQFEKTVFSDNEKEAFDLLKDERKKGFSQILVEILGKRDAIEKNIYLNYHNAQKEIAAGNYQVKIEGLKNHMAIQLAIYDTVAKELYFPFSRDKVIEQIKESTERQQELFQGTSIKGKFWEAFTYLATNDIIKGFQVDTEGKGVKSCGYRIKKIDKILQIKLDQIYPYYVNYCRSTSQSPDDKSTLRLSLTSSENESFIEPSQSGRKKSYTDKTFGSCYQFRLKNVVDIDKKEIENKYIIEGYEFDFL